MRCLALTRNVRHGSHNILVAGELGNQRSTGRHGAVQESQENPGEESHNASIDYGGLGTSTNEYISYQPQMHGPERIESIIFIHHVLPTKRV